MDAIDKFIDEKIKELKDCGCEQMIEMYEKTRNILKEARKNGADFSNCKNLNEMLWSAIALDIGLILMNKTE